MIVRVSAVDAAGDPLDCFAGTFLIVPSDTAADRPARLSYPFGSPDAAFFYYPTVAGDQLITLRQIDGTVATDGLPLIGQATLEVLPNTTAGQFWVSVARGSPAAAGTYANPFDTVTTALAKIPAPQQNPCIHVEAGTYNDRPVLTRRATVIGDSITGCILRGQGGDALTLGLDASGSRIRRLSLVEGVNPGDPISAGLWIYGAEDVVVSNCVIRSNGNGMRLEQTRGTLLHNNTILASRRDAVYSSFAGATLNSNLIRRSFACEIFEGATDSGRSLVSLYNNFGFRVLCRGFDIGPESNDAGVEFSDELNGIFDVSLDYNRLIRIVDGADPSIGFDVDRTAPDRGAYGGPWGERHDLVTVPAPWTWRWLTIGVLTVLALACLRSRRRN